jgi:hypothetical protein
MSIIRHHALLRIINIKVVSRGLGEVVIIIALELNLAVIAVNLARHTLDLGKEGTRPPKGSATQKI